MNPKWKRIQQAVLVGSLALVLLLGFGQPSQAQVSFAPAFNFPTGLAPVAVAVADLNGDGRPDLVVVNRDANTVSVLLNVAPTGGGGGGGGGGDCFVATAAFGSPLVPQVQLLREFRDYYLLPNVAGRAFVALYYTLSPPLAKLIANSEALRAIARVALTPLIGWAALVLWSPAVGLGVPLVSIAFGVPLVGRVVWRRKRASANRRPGIWRRRL